MNLRNTVILLASGVVLLAFCGCQPVPDARQIAAHPPINVQVDVQRPCCPGVCPKPVIVVPPRPVIVHPHYRPHR